MEEEKSCSLINFRDVHIVWSRFTIVEVIVELTTNYRVASIIKLNGFGVSVIQRLCKTSAKKNLYWEIKDKVVEEAFNGIRSVKKSQKVKVYGTDSTRDVRARLIEILQDRVNYHKDKFVAPILHAEMQSMEVKKNGKVEHSSNSHDDQVFSYLMALYVWYDGKDLAEKFHIMKNTIKTDQDEDIEELNIEDSIESTAKINVDELAYDPESEILKEIEYLTKNSKFTTTEDLKNEQFLRELQTKQSLLATNKDARESYSKEYGLDPSMFANDQSSLFVSLPDTLFMDTDDVDYLNEDTRRNSVLVGNMSNWWDKV